MMFLTFHIKKKYIYIYSYKFVIIKLIGLLINIYNIYNCKKKKIQHAGTKHTVSKTTRG